MLGAYNLPKSQIFETASFLYVMRLLYHPPTEYLGQVLVVDLSGGACVIDYVVVGAYGVHEPSVLQLVLHPERLEIDGFYFLIAEVLAVVLGASELGQHGPSTFEM